MSKVTYILIALIAVSALAITFSEDSDAFSYRAQIDPLVIDEDTAYSSVNAINVAANYNVCSYSDKTITFSKDTTISNKSDKDKVDLITFSSDMTIELKGATTVTINYHIVDNNENCYSALRALGNLNIKGIGSLEIIVSNSHHPSLLSCMRVDGNLTITDTNVFIQYKANKSSDHSIGLIFGGEQILFTNSNCKIIGIDSGLQFTSNKKINLAINDSELKCSGNKAIDANGKQITVDYRGKNIYASHNIDGTNPKKISVDDIFNYSYVRASHYEPSQNNESPSFTDDLWTYSPFIAFVLLFLVYLFFVFYRGRGYSVRNTKFSDRETAQDVMKTLYDDTKDQINDIRSWNEEVRDIKVKVSTDIKGGSYTVLVDGLICGHITSWNNEISLPSGRHALIITTNDELNVLILKKRMVCQNIYSIKINETDGKPQAIVEVRKG